MTAYRIEFSTLLPLLSGPALLTRRFPDFPTH